MIYQKTILSVLILGTVGITNNLLQAEVIAVDNTPVAADELEVFERVSDIDIELDSTLRVELKKVVEETEEKAAKIVTEEAVETDFKSVSVEAVVKKDGEIREVPFYSQFTDISLVSWRKVGCGVASLAMLIDYYKPAVLVDTLLKEGIATGAYLDSAGWTHQGLINLSKKYGLGGETVSLSHLAPLVALSELKRVVEEGPVMVSVHYTFEPTNPIPHLAVISDFKDGVVYYNDPAEAVAGGSITETKFLAAWKQRYISIRPAL